MAREPEPIPAGFGRPPPFRRDPTGLIAATLAIALLAFTIIAPRLPEPAPTCTQAPTKATP